MPPRKVRGPSYIRVIAQMRMEWRAPGGTPLQSDRMSAPRPPRDRQRGNSLLLALIVMSALATLGSLTVVSTQSSLKTTTNDRSQAIAMYAAESGAAVAMNFLRNHFTSTPGTQYSSWSAYLKRGNLNVVSVPTTDIPSNDVLPGLPNNLFDADQNAWFDIQFYNNRNDPLFAAPDAQCDGDGRLIIRTTGHGPQGSIAILEWEVQRTDYTRGWPGGPPLPNGFPVQPTTPGLPVVAFPWDTFAGAPPLTEGVVLVGWHIVSL
jgi:hypothetical protein